VAEVSVLEVSVAEIGAADEVRVPEQSVKYCEIPSVCEVNNHLFLPID